MEEQQKLELIIFTSLDHNQTISELETQRIAFFNYLNSALLSQAEVKMPSSSRSIDPAVIGAIAVAVLPIAIEKLSDLVIKWTELRKDCSVTINIPKGGDSIAITYNPKTTSPETLKKWIKTAVETSKATKK